MRTDNSTSLVRNVIVHHLGMSVLSDAVLTTHKSRLEGFFSSGVFADLQFSGWPI